MAAKSRVVALDVHRHRTVGLCLHVVVGTDLISMEGILDFSRYCDEPAGWVAGKLVEDSV